MPIKIEHISTMYHLSFKVKSQANVLMLGVQMCKKFRKIPDNFQKIRTT